MTGVVTDRQADGPPTAGTYTAEEKPDLCETEAFEATRKPMTPAINYQEM